MFRRLFFSILALAGAAGACRAADRPNFVWLISEDNSRHFLKLFDPHGAPTPHIEALARHGLAFDRAFSNAPVCSVARTTLITGCYGPRIGTQFHRKEVSVPLPGTLRMFPAYLREAGYYATNNSKKDYNAVEGPGVWDESSAKASWRGRRPGQPFFHKQSFATTHESSLHFGRDALKEPTRTDPSSVFLAPYHPDTPTFRYTYARYHDRIRQVDEQVGRVMAQLEQDGLLEETFVFYFGDHGGVLPRGKGYAYETGLHIPLVVRIPAKWKHLVDARPGARVGGFVSFVDFGPTLLHLAGLKVPREVDGRPFLGKGVTLAELNRRDEAFGYADRFDEKYDLVRTLRQGDLKYVRSYQPFNVDALHNSYRYKMLAYQEWRDLYRAGRLAPVQRKFFEPRAAEALYDLKADPYETRSLAGDPAHAAALARLRGRLSEWVKGMPDLSFYPESVLVEKAFEDPVPFGRAHGDEIAKLVDIADLALVPFAKARPGLERALASGDPWQRYWGLIACSAHGKEAAPLVGTARALAAKDPELLVRVRAAEFLGLLGAEDPRPVIMEALKRTRSPVEAALILNTVVLLRDGQPGYDFTVTAESLSGLGEKALQDKGGSVGRRLEYLAR